MPKKLTTKEELLKALTNDRLFDKYQLSFYYHFTETVDTSLLDDFEVMKVILEKIPRSYEYIKYTHLKDNLDLALIAAKNGNEVLKYSSKSFGNNRELVEQIIMHGNIKDAKYFSKEFLNDVEFMRKGCAITGELYKYLPNELKENDLVIQDFLKGARRVRNFLLYEYLPSRYLNDKKVVLEFIFDELSSNIYRFLNDELKNDKEINFKVAQFTLNLSSVKLDSVRDDFEIVANAIRRSPNNYLFASERLKNDEGIFNVLLERTLYDWRIYQALPDKFKQRKEILLKYDPETVYLEDVKKYVPISLQNDPDVIKHFGIDNIKEVKYFWYHGFYTAEEKKQIKNAIKNHDYDAFMKIREKNPSGLPKFANGSNEQGANTSVDITVRENFEKITSEESEAG